MTLALPENFEPMLAGKAKLDSLPFPLLGSPKLDGIRMIVTPDRRCVSRKLLDIPNPRVFALFAGLPFYDGELIVGDPTSKTVYNDTYSGVMSRDGVPDVWFYVFDHVAEPLIGYELRRQSLKCDAGSKTVMVPQTLLRNAAEFAAFEEATLDAGYEGVMLRRPDGKYKYGRSTTTQALLLKVKRFEDSEALVIGFVEEMHNANEATRDNLGRTKRSSAKSGKVGKGTLGALLVEWRETTFEIGTGFTAADRLKIWQNRDRFLGELVKFKYFPIGMKDRPRHPVFLGWRSKIDM